MRLLPIILRVTLRANRVLRHYSAAFSRPRQYPQGPILGLKPAAYRLTLGGGRLVAGQVLDVALLFLLLDPPSELFFLLGGGELVRYLGLDLVEGLGLLLADLRHLYDVVAELRLDGAHDLARLGGEGGLLEGGNGLALAEAPEVPAFLGAAGILGVLPGELGEVAAVLELGLDVLRLLLLVLVEEDVPHAALGRLGELGRLVLVVELLDFLVGGLGVARDPLLNLLDGEVLPHVLAELVLGDLVLLERLVEGLLVAEVLPRGPRLLADLALDLLYLLIHLLVGDRDTLLLGVGLGDIDPDELRHDLLDGRLVLRRPGLDLPETALLGEVLQLPLRHLAALVRGHFLRPGRRVGGSLRRLATRESG